MPIQSQMFNMKDLLPPAQIDPSQRPETVETLADSLWRKVQAFAQPVTGPINHWLNDPIQQANANMLLGGPMGMAKVWHGSPHKFNKFQMDKIGTGEGAQAYGHGLYFADNPETGKSYQRLIKKSGGWGEQEHRAFDKLKNWEGAPIPDKMKSEINAAWANSGPDAGRQKAIKLFDENRGAPFSDALNEVAFYGDWEPKGNLYKVDLPDDSIAKMLDWDKPLGEQSKGVQSLLKRGGYLKDKSKLSRSVENNGRILFRDEAGKMVGSAMPKADGRGYDLTSIKPNQFGSPLNRPAVNEAQVDKVMGGWWSGNDKTGEHLIYSFGKGEKGSQALKKQGIPGIKYLDQGSRAGGKGTYNYVVFDDQLPKILERNGEPMGDLVKSLTKKRKVAK